MAKCTKCGKEISRLSYNSSVQVTQIFSWEDGRTDYSVMDDYGDHSDEEYKCPECYETLAANEEGAIKVLNNKEV